MGMRNVGIHVLFKFVRFSGGDDGGANYCYCVRVVYVFGERYGCWW